MRASAQPRSVRIIAVGALATLCLSSQAQAQRVSTQQTSSSVSSESSPVSSESSQPSQSSQSSQSYPSSQSSSPSLTRNQLSTANTLAASNFLCVRSPLTSLASRPGDYDALSGGIQSSAVTAIAQTTFIVQQTILDHLRFGEGFGGTGIAGAAPGARLPATFTADLPGRAPPVSYVPAQVVDTRNYAFWGHAFGNFGSTATTAGARAMTREVGGFVVGIETNLPGGWKAGVAAGFSATDVDVRALRSRGEVDAGYGAVYANGPVGPLQVRAGATYMGYTLDTQRLVVIPGFADALHGRASGETVGGFGELGYRVTGKSSYVEPFVGAAEIHIRREGFTETGGAAALAVASRAWDIQTATAGVQMQAQVAGFGPGQMPLILRGLLAYRRAFGDVTPTALQSFTGAGQGFLTQGVPIDRDAFVGSVGANLQISAAATVGLAYSVQAGPHAQDHGLKGTFSYRF